jgi:hypothetical protein
MRTAARSFQGQDSTAKRRQNSGAKGKRVGQFKRDGGRVESVWTINIDVRTINGGMGMGESVWTVRFVARVSQEGQAKERISECPFWVLRTVVCVSRRVTCDENEGRRDGTTVRTSRSLAPAVTELDNCSVSCRVHRERHPRFSRLRSYMAPLSPPRVPERVSGVGLDHP